MRVGDACKSRNLVAALRLIRADVGDSVSLVRVRKICKDVLSKDEMAVVDYLVDMELLVNDVFRFAGEDITPSRLGGVV